MNSPEYSFMFNVIQEEVSNEDLYPDKTHEKSADVLYQLINNSDKAYTIGLEGGWGSGKSTVINFLNKKFEKNDSKTFFFTFDAWSHEGDPLRRNFLESLINAYDPEEKHEELKGLKDEITKRKKVTESTSTRGATVFGAWLSFFLLFVPLGLALLSQVNLQGIGLDGDAKDIDWVFTIGLVSVIAAPVWAIVWLICSLFKSDGEPIFSLFETESKDTLTQDVTEDEERTSIEFEQYFNKILYIILGKGSDCERIIVVIDNLDRVASEHALSLWATLQTFFSHSGSANNGSQFQDKTWFIIPYDKEGILKLWRGRRNTEDDIDLSPPTDEKARSFLDKTFQLIVEVHTPVMSAWIDYFKKCVNKAFTGWPKEHITTFVESYIKAMSKIDSSPTPRQMHSVINRAGALALQWKNEFSPVAICNYAILRQKHTESCVRKKLLEGYNDPELTQELSGLLFGVDKKKGIELLLSPAISEAIKAGHGDELAELHQAHGDAFFVVWRSSRSHWSVGFDHTDEYKINAVNAFYDAFKEKPKLISEDVESTIEAFKQSSDKWDLESYDYSPTLARLLEMSVKQNNLGWLRNSVERRLGLIIASLNKDNPLVDELPNIYSLMKLLKSNGKNLRPIRHQDLNYETWKKWLGQCEDYNVTFKNVVPLRKTIDEIIQHSRFGQNIPSTEDVNLLTATYLLNPVTRDWDKVVQPLISWFNLPSREGNAQEIYHLALLFLISGNLSKENIKELKECVKGNSFWSGSARANIEQNKSLPLLVAFADQKFQESSLVSTDVKDYWKQAPEESETDNILHLIKKHKVYDELWLLAKVKDNKLAVELIKRCDDVDIFNSSTGLRYIDEIQFGSETETKRIVESLCVNGVFEEVKEEIIEDPIVYSGVILSLLKYGTDDVTNQLNKIVSNISKKLWLEAIKDNSELLQCLSEPTAGFSEAFKEYLLMIINGDIEAVALDDFTSLLEYQPYLVEFDKKTIPQVAQKYIDSEKDKVSDELFDSFSGLLVNGVKLCSQEAFENKIIEWINDEKYSRIEWLINCELPKITQSKHSETLIRYVEDSLKNKENPQYELFLSLNDRLGLKIKPEDLSVPDVVEQEEKENNSSSDTK